MMRAAALALALLLSACDADANGDAAFASGVASDSAIATLAGPDQQFRSMLPQLLFRTQTMAMAAYSLGIAQNCATIRPAFDAAVTSNLPAWRANLIKAYRDNVPAVTLAKATSVGGDAGRKMLLPSIGKVGNQMQADSLPILKNATADVLKPVLEAATKVDPRLIDGAERMRQMKAAQADRSLFCGLQ